ncbi:iron complex transport system substrate-binding protein [Cryobacterium psychrotolerans]|uniref:Iron complex transport system substrate-binding protein n=1 Tax=Cryobacterium psychrotolerans TaxID=386301 RepID=A0A1G9ENN3_9MICO|nr:MULTISPECIES: putative F420-0 ABC transporter substrate-binding protein [Cryobacterium]TFD42025.1 putative F420-0 ABC transporter substrate-binding protein [Cryobacterium sp. TMT1-2-1]TFD83683.1 putative F420-0 ABC transporter substrate-binding protein [Cryobacterium psychrotolerans]SDK77693.1 iron complex transport system substrate-binding protein [Cryobacterium psychrotolerans]
MNRKTLHLGALAIAASTLLLAGCAGQPAGTAPSASATADFPVSIDNCGTTVTVQKAPERIVTIKSSTTELLLALGLGDNIVGSAFLDGPLPPALAPAGKALNVISDFLPGQEAVLGLTPDFIYGGWESNFSADGVGERDRLADLGIGSYVSPAACKAAEHMPDPLTFESVFDEITEAGALFGAADAAAALVSDQKAELAALEPASGTTTALWYSSGTDTPYVGAGIGSPAMIMDAAGLANIFGDVHDTWTSVGWESVVEANPDVIVLVDATWNTAASKIATLESSPATQGLDAVKNKRYVILPFAATEAGIRNVEAAASAIDQLAAFDK